MGEQQRRQIPQCEQLLEQPRCRGSLRGPLAALLHNMLDMPRGERCRRSKLHGLRRTWWASVKHQVPVEQLSTVKRSAQANKRRAARKFDRENRKDLANGKEYDSVAHRWHEDEEFQKQMMSEGYDKLALERIVDDAKVPAKWAPMS